MDTDEEPRISPQLPGLIQCTCSGNGLFLGTGVCKIHWKEAIFIMAGADGLVWFPDERFVM